MADIGGMGEFLVHHGKILQILSTWNNPWGQWNSLTYWRQEFPVLFLYITLQQQRNVEKKYPGKLLAPYHTSKLDSILNKH